MKRKSWLGVIEHAVENNLSRWRVWHFKINSNDESKKMASHLLWTLNEKRFGLARKIARHREKIFVL